ncbi:MAG TPA: hypothetical protein VF223_22240 [Trebonia sp.]
MNEDPAYWDSMATETARKHPLAMAAWLLTDCAVNWALAAQDKLEEKMRAAAAA